MAGIDDEDVIDLVFHDPDLDEYILVISETRPWGSTQVQLERLQEKLNTYVAFALGPQLAAMYPDAIGKRVRIQLDCVYGPDPGAASFIERAKQFIAEQGLSLSVNKLPTSRLQRLRMRLGR